MLKMQEEQAVLAMHILVAEVAQREPRVVVWAAMALQVLMKKAVLVVVAVVLTTMSQAGRAVLAVSQVAAAAAAAVEHQ